jgi:hypothetical protein
MGRLDVGVGSEVLDDVGHLSRGSETHLRYKMSGPAVDLNEVVEISRRILVALRIAATNRLALTEGLDDDSQYCFDLPGPSGKQMLTVRLELAAAPTLAEFPK